MKLAANSVFFLSPNAMSREALLFFVVLFICPGMVAAVVPGRMLYGKTCRLLKGNCSIRLNVSSKCSSSSPGKPTMTSVPIPISGIFWDAYITKSEYC